MAGEHEMIQLLERVADALERLSYIAEAWFKIKFGKQ